MILNISRLKSLMSCNRYAFNRYVRNLGAPKSMNLTDGSAFHKGVAVYQSTGDLHFALQEARTTFDKDVETSSLLPDEIEGGIVEQHWSIAQTCIEKFVEAWQDQPITVLQPECEFLVPFFNTEHNDITLHHKDWKYIVKPHTGNTEVWGYPDPVSVLKGDIDYFHCEEDRPAPDPSCKCWQPHQLAGRTDGIILWNGKPWLQEHKTTSRSGDSYWEQWHMDIQITGYMYGVWKATGIKPKGVILNAMYKPSEAQVAEWQRRSTKSRPKSYEDYIKYEYKMFSRTDEDLARFEREFAKWCDEWERSLVSGWWPMRNLSQNCMSYNRRCDFWHLCLDHNSPSTLENYGRREEDYVDLASQSLVQIAGTTK